MFQKVHMQNSQELNVVDGIFGDSLLGLVVLPGNLIDGMHLDMLKTTVDPTLTINIDNIPAYTEEELRYQQDRTPLYYSSVIISMKPFLVQPIGLLRRQTQVLSINSMKGIQDNQVASYVDFFYRDT